MTQLRNFLFILVSLVSLNCFSQSPKINDLVGEGIKYHDQGEYEKAISYYKKALGIDENSSLVNYEIAYSYLGSKDYKNAVKYSKKVIKLKEGHELSAYITYGNALDMMGKANKAIKMYEKAIKDYDNYLLYYNHAFACLNSNHLDKAYTSAIKAINKKSSHASSHLILSKIMEKKGSRVKAMLPLYFFLLIEPNSERAAIEYQTLRAYMNHGISRTNDKTINIQVPSDNDPSFGAAEMMISMSKVSSSLDENKNKTDLELFADTNKKVLGILGELKKDNKGFWWDFYVPFFNGLVKEDLITAYSYYISLSMGDKAVNWIDENKVEFEKFKNYLGN